MTHAQTIALIAQLIIGLGGALLAAWVAARLTMSRFYKERMWERKADAYTVVFEGLHDMLEWYASHMDAEIEGRELTDARKAELGEAYRIAKQRVARRIAGEAWLLSTEADDLMSDCFAELEKRRGSWFEHIDEGYGALANAQAHLRRFARFELGIADKPLPKGLVKPWETGATAPAPPR